MESVERDQANYRELLAKTGKICHRIIDEKLGSTPFAPDKPAVMKILLFMKLWPRRRPNLFSLPLKLKDAVYDLEIREGIVTDHSRLVKMLREDLYSKGYVGFVGDANPSSKLFNLWGRPPTEEGSEFWQKLDSLQRIFLSRSFPMRFYKLHPSGSKLASAAIVVCEARKGELCKDCTKEFPPEGLCTMTSEKQ
jgi:hypothetical protein